MSRCVSERPDLAAHRRGANRCVRRNGTQWDGLAPNCWAEVGPENTVPCEQRIESAQSTARSPAIATDGVGGTESSHNSYVAPYGHGAPLCALWPASYGALRVELGNVT